MSIIEEMVQRITELELRLDNLVQPAQAYHYQPITVVKGWAGETDKISQVLDLQAAPWNLPAGIKTIVVYLAYTAANNGDWGSVGRVTGEPSVRATCPDAGEIDRAAGMVNCDTSGDIYFQTNNATNRVSIWIYGYYI